MEEVLDSLGEGRIVPPEKCAFIMSYFEPKWLESRGTAGSIYTPTSMTVQEGLHTN